MLTRKTKRSPMPESSRKSAEEKDQPKSAEELQEEFKKYLGLWEELEKRLEDPSGFLQGLSERQREGLATVLEVFGEALFRDEELRYEEVTIFPRGKTPESSPSAFSDPSSSQDPEPISSSEMHREELKAHLEANEERVRRMTEGVSEKLDKHLEVMQESNERFKAEVREDLAVMKESNKWTYRLTAATLTVLIIVVGLIGILLGG